MNFPSDNGRDLLSMIDVTKLKYLSSGRSRDVYLLPSGRNVIKVPRNEKGQVDNWHEYAFHMKRDCWNGKDRSYAQCRIIPGTDLLVMEYLRVTYYQALKRFYRLNLKQIPGWVDFIDCQQVGFDCKGRLKAYDYGIY